MAWEYNHKYREKNKSIIDNALSHGCIDCGNTDTRVLDFDHARGIKKFSITTGWYSRKTEALIEEINKCDVVCANCHRIRTYERKRILSSEVEHLVEA